MGGKNSKSKGGGGVKTEDVAVTLKEKDIANKTAALTKEQGEADAAAKVAAKEKAEAEVAQKSADKEKAEHDVAKANLKKEEEEAEAARIAALEAGGNLNALVEAYETAKKEAEGANALTKSTKQKKVEKLAAAVEVAKKAKKEADAKAEKERLEAEEAARIEEKERLEAEEAARIAEKERLEAEEAARIAEKERLEAEAAALALQKAKEDAEQKAREEAEAAAAALKKAEEEAVAKQKAREAAPEYHSGMLEKKGDDMLGKWKPRYFIARNQDKNFTIEYFEKKGGAKKGDIDCHGYKAVVFSSKDSTEHGDYGVKIVADKANGRTWWLKAESEAERAEWIHVLSRACEKANYVEEKVTDKVEEKVDEKVNDEDDDVEDREVTPGAAAARLSIAVDGVPAGHIKCIKCDTIKVKAEFSKSQQKNKKNAKCKSCTESN